MIPLGGENEIRSEEASPRHSASTECRVFLDACDIGSAPLGKRLLAQPRDELLAIGIELLADVQNVDLDAALEQTLGARETGETGADDRHLHIWASAKNCLITFTVRSISAGG